MADTFLTLAQLVIINDRNAVDAGCSDLFDDAPLMGKLAATVASNGTAHKYLKETVQGQAAFRAVNAGLDNILSTDAEVTADLKILDASFAVDKASADAYFKGPEAYIARESRRALRAAMFGAEKQLVNGTNSDASGFVGMAQGLNTTGNSYVVNAAGTTATTGSSVYLIRTNDLGTDAMAIIGQSGKIEIGATTTQRVLDGSSKPFPAYYTPVTAWMGLQLGAAYSIVRIANLTADSGKGLTDALIASALAKFPASRQPNLVVMGRRSLAQLQQSRTSYNPTGAPAEIPNQAFNIPIVVTDAITATETLLAAS